MQTVLKRSNSGWFGHEMAVHKRAVHSCLYCLEFEFIVVLLVTLICDSIVDCGYDIRYEVKSLKLSVFQA